MEVFFTIVILGGLAALVYRNGKREGSRKAFTAGWQRATRRFRRN